MSNLTLMGLKVSVYTRVARATLVELDLDHGFEVANPFNDPPDGHLARWTRFNRIPILHHGEFAVHETQAILFYLDALAPGRSLLPAEAMARGRVLQVMGIIDSYGYWPLVRQVFAQRVFRPLEGLPPDEAEIRDGLQRAAVVLATLEDIAQEARVLNGRDLTLADLYLAPMIDYFAMAPEGGSALAQFPALSRWWRGAKGRSFMEQTAPDLDRLA